MHRSPAGDRHHGWWRVTQVEPPRSLEVDDGFANADGTHNTDLPVTRMRIVLADRGDGGTDVAITSHFDSAEQLEKMLEMGMEEGLRAAMGQMDDLVDAA